eukprot:CAMPEP_0203948110 /NCGR_PEP_ID=MMETSP0359-20131031/82868_1 /ASSEMBLY_ACC=CAM_ASM_000338 /TAXON_ID=268821 /ORGANISM="Scrippsiella Hangoei, Strain SHTV-5" /LENGTH=45 /DNA_ID= /DNA_START= /DNA_END= /DNA_ORIENTATION=
MYEAISRCIKGGANPAWREHARLALQHPMMRREHDFDPCCNCSRC